MSQNAVKYPKCGRAIKAPQKIVYNHQMAAEFRDCVQAIKEAFIGIKRDLDAEKRQTERIRSKREKNAEETACALARLCGESDAMVEGFLAPLKSRKTKQRIIVVHKKEMRMIDYEIVRQSVKIFKKLEKLVDSEGVSSHEILMCALKQGFLPPITKGAISKKKQYEFVNNAIARDI